MMILRLSIRLRPIRFGCRLLSESHKGVLLVSIGNPEPQYQNTRHNAGHWLAKELQRHLVPTKFGPWQTDLSLKSDVSESEDNTITLVRSMGSLMNIQGVPVRNIVKLLGKDKTVLVVHDELQKDIGTVQLRGPGTSARGHNGLKSIDNVLGKGYHKLSVGIGRPVSGKKSVSDYVLSKFTVTELAQLEEVIEKAANIVKRVSEQGGKVGKSTVTKTRKKGSE